MLLPGDPDHVGGSITTRKGGHDNDTPVPEAPHPGVPEQRRLSDIRRNTDSDQSALHGPFMSACVCSMSSSLNDSVQSELLAKPREASEDDLTLAQMVHVRHVIVEIHAAEVPSARDKSEPHRNTCLGRPSPVRARSYLSHSQSVCSTSRISHGRQSCSTSRSTFSTALIEAGRLTLTRSGRRRSN